MRVPMILLAVCLLTACVRSDEDVNVSGTGATFPYPIYAPWVESFNKETGIVLNYQPTGSGAGIKQISVNTVTIGGTDMPLTPEILERHGLIQFPTDLGGVVPIVNIENIAGGKLVLDGPTLAKIFLCEIKFWNHQAIRKLNPDVRLPAQRIVVIHRSNGSGTTFIFTNYLSKVSEHWNTSVSSNTNVEWQCGIGAWGGNEGVASNVANTKGSIGYVEYAYAKQNKLAFTRMVNKDGHAVAPSLATFRAAAENADWAGTPHFAVILTNQPGAASWPMTGASFILMRKRPESFGATVNALKFFDWAYAKGGDAAEKLDYVPVPKEVVSAIQELWATQIKDASGKPLYAISK